MSRGNTVRSLGMFALLGLAAPLAALGQADESDPMQGFVSQAIADLAARLSIEPSAVKLVETRAVSWPDASLGCPRPDMKYKQVPVDGYRILLRVNGREYAYHGDGRRGPFYCPEPTPPGKDKGRPLDRDPTA